MNCQASHSHFSIELLTTICGLSGVILLSEGNTLASQGFFCISNPLLVFTSWAAGAKTTAFLFLIYWFFSIRGVLLCLGVL